MGIYHYLHADNVFICVVLSHRFDYMSPRTYLGLCRLTFRKSGHHFGNMAPWTCVLEHCSGEAGTLSSVSQHFVTASVVVKIVKVQHPRNALRIKTSYFKCHEALKMANSPEKARLTSNIMEIILPLLFLQLVDTLSMVSIISTLTSSVEETLNDTQI